MANPKELKVCAELCDLSTALNPVIRLESFLLEKLIKKNRNQHRRANYFRRLVQIFKHEDLTQSAWADLKTTAWTALYKRNVKLDACASQIEAVARLSRKGIQLIHRCAKDVKGQISFGFFLPFMVLLYSVIARIFVLRQKSLAVLSRAYAILTQAPSEPKWADMSVDVSTLFEGLPQARYKKDEYGAEATDSSSSDNEERSVTNCDQVSKKRRLEVAEDQDRKVKKAKTEANSQQTSHVPLTCTEPSPLPSQEPVPSKQKLSSIPSNTHKPSLPSNPIATSAASENTSVDIPAEPSLRASSGAFPTNLPSAKATGMSSNQPTASEIANFLGSSDDDEDCGSSDVDGDESERLQTMPASKEEPRREPPKPMKVKAKVKAADADDIDDIFAGLSD